MQAQVVVLLQQTELHSFTQPDFIDQSSGEHFLGESEL